MISIVICKYDVANFQRCIKSIDDTKTEEYELVVIDNTLNKYDIFTAYNEGIKQSNGDYICFMHEDIVYFEKGWMAKIHAHFENDSDVGMLGLAGGSSFTMFPLFWGLNYHVDDSAICLVELQKDGPSVVRRGFKKDTKQALIVDGFWFCVRKELITQHHITFDSNNFKGFHRYDYDISFQIAQLAKIMVVQDILIIHYSSGSRKKEWLQATLDFHNKWKALLPCKIEEGKSGITKLEKSDADLVAFSTFILMMKKLDFNRSEIVQVIRQNQFAANSKIKKINKLKLKLIALMPYLPYSVLLHTSNFLSFLIDLIKGRKF